MKILFYSGELSPYRLARYDAITRLGKHDITVAQVPVEGHGFDDSARRLYSVNIYEGDMPSVLWCNEQIRNGMFNVVFVHGYWHPESRKIARIARKYGCIVVIDYENSIYDKKRSLVLENIKKIWLSKFTDYAFVPGERAAQYAEYLGFKRDRILTGLFATDVDYYMKEVDIKRSKLNSIREAYSLPDRYMLFCGWLREPKNVLSLARAYDIYRKRVDDPMQLIMLGKGEQADAISNMNIEGIRIDGFVQLDVLTSYYAAATCFVLTSVYDPWPLVLLEAVASGLPVIASWKCGNTVELIRDGWNGWLCDPYDPCDIARCMVSAHRDERIRRTARYEGRNLAMPYTADAWAHKLDYHLSRISLHE